MPFVPVAETAEAVAQVNEYTSRDYEGDIYAGDLTGVAATAIAVNELIVGSQWSSLGFAVALTLMTLQLYSRILDSHSGQQHLLLQQ